MSFWVLPLTFISGISFTIVLELAGLQHLLEPLREMMAAILGATT